MWSMYHSCTKYLTTRQPRRQKSTPEAKKVNLIETEDIHDSGISSTIVTTPVSTTPSITTPTSTSGTSFTSSPSIRSRPGMKHNN